MINCEERPWRGFRHLAAPVALATALLAIGCGQPPACPTGAPLKLDLEAWRRALPDVARATGRTPVYQSFLAELGVEPLPGGASAPPWPEDGAMTIVSLESVPLRRGAAPADRLVAARFRNSRGAESLRAQVLRPLPGRDDLYCALGGELSRDQERFEEPCLEPHGGPARSLAREQLVARDRDAVVARDAGGWCGPGSSRGDRLATSYWGVEGGRLVRYLEVVTFESWYESPVPPIETRRATIELSDGWPRTITVSEIVECRAPDETAPAGDCEPSASRREYHYVEDRYVEVGPAATPTAGPAGRATEETGR